jgi:hypothetical protein
MEVGTWWKAMWIILICKLPIIGIYIYKDIKFIRNEFSWKGLLKPIKYVAQNKKKWNMGCG